MVYYVVNLLGVVHDTLIIIYLAKCMNIIHFVKVFLSWLFYVVRLYFYEGVSIGPHVFMVETNGMNKFMYNCAFPCKDAIFTRPEV